MNETVRLDDMRVFWQVAVQGSFTAAGQALSMPKQTVSRRVAELERRLGVQLLYRTTRALRLTHEGRLYADHCEELVRVAEAAHAAVHGNIDVPRGRLRLSADPHFAEHFLVDALRRFTTEHSAVSVELVATERRVDLVEEGFDLAIRIGRLQDSTSLVARRLAPAHIAYVASPSYLQQRGVPEVPDDLLAHDIVGGPQSQGATSWPFVQAGEVRLVALDPRLVVNRQELVQRLVLQGAGVGLFPRFSAAPHLASGALVQVLASHTPAVGDIWAVYHRSRAVPARVHAFVELLAQEMRAHRTQL